tara:strand:+ start:14723 stop:15172 length:450 start_codon:yes stop_codon:yes gene_type:complete
MNTLNRLGGRELLANSLSGCDDSARILLDRFNKRIRNSGPDHPMTVRLAGWLREIRDFRAEDTNDPAPAPVEYTLPVGHIIKDGVEYAPVGPAPAVASKKKGRAFSADTVKMVQMHDGGMTYAQIATAMGRSGEAVVGAAVRRYRKANG